MADSKFSRHGHAGFPIEVCVWLSSFVTRGRVITSVHDSSWQSAAGERVSNIEIIFSYQWGWIIFYISEIFIHHNPRDRGHKHINSDATWGGHVCDAGHAGLVTGQPRDPGRKRKTGYWARGRPGLWLRPQESGQRLAHRADAAFVWIVSRNVENLLSYKKTDRSMVNGRKLCTLPFEALVGWFCLLF